jgi:hypothetical protein
LRLRTTASLLRAGRGSRECEESGERRRGRNVVRFHFFSLVVPGFLSR